MSKITPNYDNYTDIHIHILPGVDDGSKNLDMSLEMLRHAYAEGIRRMVVTPHNKPMHHNVGKEKMQELIHLLRAQMKQEKIEIELYPGNELYYREDLVKCLEEGKASTMADSRYVLLEFQPADRWEYIRDGVNDMLMAGYRPILAHIERYQEVCKDVERVIRLREMGCCIQVNAASVMGRYGMGIKGYVKKLLKQRLVDFIATDAHNATNRTPDMAKCAEYICKKYGAEYMHSLLTENPSKVIRDEYI
ncbi:MAG: hypothetical protein J6K48_00190 [Lachnospiraceae bacterium]|nr:hypothetical protein [Lachnospiraceae bacterium]